MIRRARIERLDSHSVTVHVLAAGKPLCGFSRHEPASWPRGHAWVNADRGHLASCPKCQRLLLEVKQR